MTGRKKGLRSGYTTGACAAAAAKAAMLVMRNALSVKSKKSKNIDSRITRHASRVTDVEIPFPDGNRVRFRVQGSGVRGQNSAWASVIKDAGDDPDVTNGAEIKAEAKIQNIELAYRTGRHRTYLPDRQAQNTDKSKEKNSLGLFIKGGEGVGIVTKPGLPVPVGEPAINPVPRQMIKEAVMEALKQNTDKNKANPGYGLWAMGSDIEITISVLNGEELAKKTLNARLGILGGISILGTTGTVMPVSSEAWTATITSSMDVAKAMGIKEIILSAGRASEKAHIKKYNLPEESYVLMGDYLEYSLKEAKRHGFKRIHLCAQWAKMLKIAMATPQTHVRFGAINIKKAVGLLNSPGIEVPAEKEFNTAREIFEFIDSSLKNPPQPPFAKGGKKRINIFSEVCNIAGRYTEGIAGVPVSASLVSYKGEIIAESE